jgi:hypothetical protein
MFMHGGMYIHLMAMHAGPGTDRRRQRWLTSLRFPMPQERLPKNVENVVARRHAITNVAEWAVTAKAPNDTHAMGPVPAFDRASRGSRPP